MDLVSQLVHRFNVWYIGTEEQSLMPLHLIALSLLSFLLIVIISSFLIFRKHKAKVAEIILPDTSKPRFRKRDKVLFYGRQMLRKVRTTLTQGGKNNPRELPPHVLHILVSISVALNDANCFYLPLASHVNNKSKRQGKEEEDGVTIC